MIRKFVVVASVVAGAFVALACASEAAAQDARAHFMRGQACYDTGDYPCAVREWSTAYGIDPRPLLQFNLAQAYERLGQLQEAIDSYERYVNSADTDPDRMSAARARIAALRDRLRNTSIRLSGGQEGAQIILDGQDRGRLPHPDPLPVTPGSHRIVIRLQGFQDFVSTIAVSAGQSVDVPVEMVSGESGRASTGGGGISMIGIIVAASGAAVAIGGAITGGLALASADASVVPTDGAANDARTLALVTDILIPVGAVAAVTGLVLMFVLPEGGGGSAQVVPVVGPGLAGVSVLGQF
ncbi:MAG: PEGA domain-containing protein [Sandaracinaceae bacterium]|nr:PEGA domain-containing protein [Sandaracinaceae bacterium]